MVVNCTSPPARGSAKVSAAERVGWQRLLESEIRQVIGCTEPACLAHALRTAARYLAAPLDPRTCRATLRLSDEVFRNASTATVPFLKRRGIRAAAAAGLASRAAGLNVFPTVHLAAAERLLRRRGWLRVIRLRRHGLHVRAELDDGRNRVTVVIEGRHDQVRAITRNGRKLLCAKPSPLAAPGLPDMFRAARNRDRKLERQALDFLLHQPWGAAHLPLGKRLARLVRERMTGTPHAVWTITGSGNQGLFLALPLLDLYQEQGRRALPAVVFALLAQIRLSRTRRRISDKCGLANKAAPALAAGLAYARGADLPALRRVIRAVTRDLRSLECRGARASCGGKAEKALRVVRKRVEALA